MKPRGFATMTPEQRAEISRKGGKAAHAAGTAYEFSSEKAREAGRKGGIASRDALRRRQEAADRAAKDSNPEKA